MGRPSLRDKILQAGLKVVHARGFANASVREIVQAAGAPQGSFTNHFASKAAFGQEILEIYYEKSRALAQATLLDASLTPLDRIRAFLDAAPGSSDETTDAIRSGCLIGNFSAEIGEHGDALRRRIAEMLDESERDLAGCLRAAKAAGQLAPDLDAQDTAVHILSALQGAILLAKVRGSRTPIEQMKRTLFTMLLQNRA